MMLTKFTNIFFVLLQGAAILNAVSANCPPPEAVSPCSCHDESTEDNIVLFCSDPETRLEQIKNALHAMRNLPGFRLELDGLNLGSVPSDFFRDIRVKELDINQCDLGDFHEAFTGLTLLEHLTIISSFTEDNEQVKLPIKYLKNLRKLELSYNHITELGNDWFKDAPASLRHVFISNNAIETIGSKAFADISNLESLSLDGNRFGHISRSMLPNPAKELDTLELDNNDFPSLPNDIFTNMPYLKRVSLTSNSIMKLDESTWKTIWPQLDYVDLRGNPLTCNAHLKWISKTATCADVQGSCQAPKEKALESYMLRDPSCA